MRPEVVDWVERISPGARLEPLAGDASKRRFFRVHPASGASRVLMDYGRPFERPTDDQLLSALFREAGLPVARIVDGGPAVGCLLLEDLGDRTLHSALAELGGAGRPLLERAVRLAAEVARRGTPVLERSERAGGPALDAERFRFEMDWFVEHYVRGLQGRDPVPATLRPALHALADEAARSPRRVFCHRDFHSRNLMLRDDGTLAMVDLQDARWGPDTYDLASLLRDAYVEIHESWLPGLIDLYLEGMGEPRTEEFLARLDVVSCQRMIKALGSFGSLRDAPGAERYLEAVPRTLERLRRLLPSRPETHALAVVLTEADLLRP